VVQTDAALDPLKENHHQGKGMELSTERYFICSLNLQLGKHAQLLTGGKETSATPKN
jgi:hypothetical protein